MAKIEYIKNKRDEIVYPVTKEGAIYDDNGVLLSSKIATFITRLVNNLANYYLKSETYTKEEVNNLIGTIQSFAYIVVSELPTASALTEGIIYLVPSEDPQTQNVKDEYITIRSGSIGSYTYSWEQIGSTAIDLSGYVTTEALNTALANYTTTANLTTLLAGKQDALVSGENIKTVGGQSVLGSGDIPVGDENAVKFTPQTLTDAQKAQARTNIGATAPEIFWATYGVTTAAEIEAALNAGKIVAMLYSNKVYFVTANNATNYLVFTSPSDDTIFNIRVNRSDSSYGNPFNLTYEQAARKKSTISGNESSDAYYPTTKAVADAIEAGKQIFWAEYGVNTLSEITTAYNSGKAVLCLRQGALYVISRLETTYCYFTCVNRTASQFLLLNGQTSWSAGTVSLQSTGNLSQSVPTDLESTTKYPSVKAVWDELKVRPVMDATSQETVPSLNLENTANKSQDVQTDRESIVKYPSVKAVFDSLGKWGVISQTQTWTGSDATGYDYTMSNQVYGLIPQANIDLFVSAGASAGAVFNESTGYFELNGLTDVSYNEMLEIYKRPITNQSITSWYLSGKIRTTLPNMGGANAGNGGANMAMGNAFNSSNVEVVHLCSENTFRLSSGGTAFRNARRLRKIQDMIRLDLDNPYMNQDFSGCCSLEYVHIKTKNKNLELQDSPRLQLESVVFMVQEAVNTSAITITLHATAYARCQADTTEYTYNGQTYTGIIALATAKNISIASAS